ncbi:HNH endonuclease [Anaerostipes faecalis]|uniref:HNH endonuclease n=1 Tax=Anaerostipes faecalis TaxID=2738446 RepID=UPI001C1E61AB|nr:HNH endonuclease [Anaerostipes faecalis]
MWKDIPGYNGRYQESQDGQISRLYKNGKRKIFAQYVKKRQRGSKRYYVKLTNPDTGKSTDVAVHKIILITYVGPCPDGYIPVHKNGICEDNFISNLCYMDKSKVGQATGAKSKRKPVVKINQNGEIEEFYSSAREAGRKNYMSYQTIIDRCNGKVKSVFAPDGYAYSWDDERRLQKVIRKIELENGYMPKKPEYEDMW